MPPEYALCSAWSNYGHLVAAGTPAFSSAMVLGIPFPVLELAQFAFINRRSMRHAVRGGSARIFSPSKSQTRELLPMVIFSPVATEEEFLDRNEALLQPIDAGGVLPILLTVAGYSALERSSDNIESHDLIRAIYIVDLEHVSEFWNHWEGFEAHVSSGYPVANRSPVYINRVLYLVRLEVASREHADEFVTLGNASPSLMSIVARSREIAYARTGERQSPSSRDLLFSACMLDGKLSQSLEKSGLLMAKLKEAVKGA